MPGLLTLSLLIAHLDVAGFRAQVDAGKPPLDSDSISKLLLLAALRATQFRGLSSTDIARDISRPRKLVSVAPATDFQPHRKRQPRWLKR